jgi:hypothetical protein
MADESNLGFAYEFGNRTACPICVQIVAATPAYAACLRSNVLFSLKMTLPLRLMIIRAM